ncbi:hypothetical protein [Flavobacterium sp. S87F.05.LMB.W.Kidney.N]|uniref:hypothetical protein n=1 Tax=Flavobacterium sp. S87F.05.LMB.W.Kidney.N TaxID=1278758 RepID=UPI001064FF1A|nr:hypothetical protein [Flavobacterium sp. S87F.05.LMB.W.Kidney.N]TDX09454.1 hypothetical protein EDB96_3753 [Flavobacterium sp. S87F.05.LMB.W.Kidney.N]
MIKHFTHPEGKFIIALPVEWQYKNVAVGEKEEPPFSFELYEETVGCFQISIYHENEKSIPKNLEKQKCNKDNLDFVQKRMDGGGFNMHLFYAVVEDHLFMAKYIYDTKDEKSEKISEELIKVMKALKTLQLLSSERRAEAIEIDKYEKFMSSLAASFDLLNIAYKNSSEIEIIIIIANQIDAYLRLAIVMKKQLISNTNEIDIRLLYQEENDKPIFERHIYKLAKELVIINQDIFNRLEYLYSDRNRMVHRYIISDLKTRDIGELSIEYVLICEEIRLILASIEDDQFDKQIGIYGGKRNPKDEHSKESINFLHSQVNDKHLVASLQRKIDLSNNDKLDT